MITFNLFKIKSSKKAVFLESSKEKKKLIDKAARGAIEMQNELEEEFDRTAPLMGLV
jgi:hypothetical protein